MRGGCRCLFALWLALVPCGLCGCLGHSFVDPDYRYRDAQVDQLRGQLYTGEFGATTRHRDGAQNPEAAHVTAYPQTAPTLSKQYALVLTAALAGERGETLRVVAELRDGAGRAVHVPAALHLSVLQPGPEAQTTFLGDWELPQQLLEHAWTAGWSGGGYRVILPWKTWPSAEQVRVVARLTLADGTHYESEKVLPLRATATGKEASSGMPVRQVQGQAGEPGSAVQAADLRWEPPSLEGAMSLGRPVPLAEDD